MKVAIHHIEKGFSQRWIDYCKEKNVDYLLVDITDTNIFSILKQEKVTHLMCHVPNEDSKLIAITNGVFHAAELCGIKTFPSVSERWHFDNKIYQKYLLESIGAPFVSTQVFYEEADALLFLENVKLPIVSKLKRGAGSVNVSLINSKEEGKEIVKKMFTKGVNPVPKISDNLKDKINYTKQFKNPIEIAKKAKGYFERIVKERQLVEMEKSYVLFQEFLPNNKFDTRIVVSNDIAFALRRLNRENDFRASGSGIIEYDQELIDLEMVKIAFEISDKCNFDLMGYDFLYDEEKRPIVVEMCYGFTANAYDKCLGYWTKDLTFHREPFSPHKRMIHYFLHKN